MLFAVCSDRGAPGATTLALALASARGLPSVVIEADPYGGDLALRCRIGGGPLPPTPTVLGLGAGMSAQQAAQMVDANHNQNRHGDGANGQTRRLDLWRDGSHKFSDLVRVVPGFLTAEQGASLAWSSVTATVESQLVPVFADLGRIHSGSPSMPIAVAADVLITVCRGDVASVQHMIWRLEQLVPRIAEGNGRTPIVVPVVVTAGRNGPQAADQVAELLAETPVGPTMRGVGSIAWDPAAVTDLYAGGDPWARPLRTSSLMKSARRVMWLLGRGTGLEHADPYEEQKRARRSRNRDQATESQTPASRPDGVPHAGGTPPVPPTRSPVSPTDPEMPTAPVNGHAVSNGAVPSFTGFRRPWRPAETSTEAREEG